MHDRAIPESPGDAHTHADADLHTDANLHAEPDAIAHTVADTGAAHHGRHPSQGYCRQPAKQRVFVGSKTTGSVYKIDGASNTIVGQWPAGREPTWRGREPVDGQGLRGELSEQHREHLRRATGSTLATVNLGALGYREPSMVTIDETANRAYVTLHGSALAVI